MIPFLLAGILGLLFPVVLCGGHAIVEELTLTSALSLILLMLVAKFLFSTLFDKSLSKEISNHYDREVDNVLYRLVLRALPELKDKEFSIGEYNCYLPFIRELFIKDLKFMLSNEELYKL